MKCLPCLTGHCDECTTVTGESVGPLCRCIEHDKTNPNRHLPEHKHGPHCVASVCQEPKRVPGVRKIPRPNRSAS